VTRMDAPMDTHRALPLPCLMLVTDRLLAGGTDALVAAVRRAVEGGVNVVQVREKDLPQEEQVEICCRLIEAVAGRALVIVNDRPTVALAAGASGVHGAEKSLPVAAMRRGVRRRLLIGRSVHSLDGAADAAHAGADYLVLGTIFPSRSHPGRETGGVALVSSVAAAVAVPVIAIGGLGQRNVAEVMRAGAAGIAVITALLGREDVCEAAQELRGALDRAWELGDAARGSVRLHVSSLGAH
jgi:thiamine-phosphate pyrophosphorylase